MTPTPDAPPPLPEGWFTWDRSSVTGPLGARIRIERGAVYFPPDLNGWPVDDLLAVLAHLAHRAKEGT